MEIPKYIQNKIRQQIEACEKAKKLEQEIDNWCGLSGINTYNVAYKETKGRLIDAVSPINAEKLKELADELNFASSVHLNKFCKIWFGMTPSEVRQTFILKKNLR